MTDLKWLSLFWKMRLRKHIFAWVSLRLFVWLSLLFSSTDSCDYEIDNLARQCVRPTDKEIYSTMDTGTSVFTVTVLILVEDHYSPTKYDIVMITSSSNYDLIYVVNDEDDHHEVVIRNCLQTGDKEYLAFTLNETLPYNTDCGAWFLEINVEPSKPNFTIPSSVNVRVSSCLPDIDVIELQFHNGGNCSSWNCSANCTDDAKIFWIEGRTVRTSINNTNFSFTYEIRVTCFDDRAGSAIDETTGDAMVNVTFVDAGFMGSCAETTPPTTSTTTSTLITLSSISTLPTMSTVSIMSTMSTMSNQGVVQQQEPVVFFQTPRNIALLAFFGGLLVGIPIGVVIYLAAKRYACNSAVVGNGVN